MSDETLTPEQKHKIDPKAFLSIIRPQNCIIGSLTVISGIAIAFQMNPIGIGLSTYLNLFILGYLIYFVVAAAGNIVNDIFDIEVDKINRPHRALPSGRMTIKQAWAFVIVLSVIGALLALWVGVLSMVIVVIFEIVGFSYAAKVKQLGIAGNFMVAFSFAFGVIFGSFIYGETVGALQIPLPSWLFFLTAFMILQARETIKGAEDVEGDELRDVRTIARVYGYRAAAAVQAVLNLIGVSCYLLIWILGFASPNLWVLMVLGAAVVLGATVLPITGPSNKKRLLYGSTLDKIGALIGLIAFVVIPFYAVPW